MHDHANRAAQAANRQRDQRPDAGRFGRPSALTTPQHLPVVQTDEFRVVEPDGTEDPWASADDGLVPDKPAVDDTAEQQRKQR